jgi:hypothetical protein
MSAHEYETNFLQNNDCAKNQIWLNQHNNIGKATTAGMVCARHKVTREITVITCDEFH